MSQASRLTGVLLVGLACGCGKGSSDFVDPFHPNIAQTSPQLHRVVPTDQREVVSAARPPVPISGGTLLVTRDGLQAVAADPDRDRVSIVDIAEHTLRYTVELEAGDMPGRMAEDAAGRIHVALRGAGAVVSIDRATGTVVDRRGVCSAPRGIAFDLQNDNLLVACAGGEVATLPAQGGEVSVRTQVTPDLRDVLIDANGDVFVTAFKHASVWRLPGGRADGMSSTRPAVAEVEFQAPDGSSTVLDTLEPEVAWRTVRNTRDGSMVMLHQGARVAEIPLSLDGSDDGDDDDSDSDDHDKGDDSDGQNGPTNGPMNADNSGASAYGGGGGGCSSVVQSELTVVDAHGVPGKTMRFDGVLAVDVATSSSGTIAVVQAGTRDNMQPAITFETDSQDGADGRNSIGGKPFSGATPAFMVFDPNSVNSIGDCMFPTTAIDIEGQATAVAQAGNTFIVQTREQASLVFITDVSFETVTLPLGGDSVYDTGHEIFHRDAGAGIACASCHAEGTEDGHVWRFGGVGPRRTQSLNVGLEGTAPFHWSGDQSDISALMEEVFVSRMGGVHENKARSGALESYLYDLQPLAPMRAAEDLAAVRGKALFDGEAECATCHNGSKFTDNKTVDVGTGEPMQVPSLIGVGYRSPLIHTGCAATLKDRFDPACGGDKHGKVAQLSPDGIDDLIAYLQTI